MMCIIINVSLSILIGCLGQVKLISQLAHQAQVLALSGNKDVMEPPFIENPIP